MNKRTFLKGSAALSIAPMLLNSIVSKPALATTQALRDARKTLGPVPTYAYDSVREVMTFYRADRGTQAMHAYFATR